MTSNYQGMQTNVTKFTTNKEKIPIVWCKQWMQGSGQVCWEHRPSSHWGGIRRLLKKVQKKPLWFTGSQSQDKLPDPSAKRKFHEILKNDRPTKRPMAGHKGTPECNSSSTWTELKKQSCRRSQWWEELKEFWIKKLHVEKGFRTNKIVSCHTAMVTLKVDVEKFKGSSINCCEKWANTRPVCFIYTKVWFNNGICRSTSVLVCTILEFLSCGNWNYWFRNIQTSQ